MMNVGLGIGDIILGNESSMVEALLIGILVIWVPFWIYKAYMDHKITKLVWDRIVNSWYFNQEIRNGYYRCKFDIDPSKSIKIYDKEECDRSLSLRGQYDQYKRETIYLPRPFLDKEYWDGIMLGKYGGYVLRPNSVMTKGDYWFATFNGVETKDHIWEIDMDRNVITAAFWYVKAVKATYEIWKFNKNSFFAKLLKEAEMTAERLIYGEKYDEEWFYKICSTLDIMRFTDIYNEEEPEKVIKKIMDRYVKCGATDDVGFYPEVCGYIKEYIEKIREVK